MLVQTLDVYKVSEIKTLTKPKSQEVETTSCLNLLEFRNFEMHLLAEVTQ